MYANWSRDPVISRRISRFITLLACLSIVLLFGTPLPAARAANLAEVPENHPPEGEDWGSEGETHSQYCVAVGWVMDQDDPERIIDIQVFADGNSLMIIPADFYCEGGACLFFASLWGMITPLEEHVITVKAYDVETDLWFDLAWTSKTLSCVNFDIYSTRIKTGEIERITSLEETGEYNSSWSPDGKNIVHDVVTFWGQDLFITNLETRETLPLAGGEGGNDAAWSPNGKWIVFDRGMDIDDPHLYLIRPNGGTPFEIRADAVNADWAPNSHMLVYQRYSDGSLRTARIKGGDETLLVPLGNSPAWSPNGQWIAYELDGDLWKVKVDLHGIPQGDPIQLTSGPTWDAQPTWSKNSKTIVFTSNAGGNFDQWMISAAGGEPIWIAGVPEFGDYDPDFSNNGRFVAWSRPQTP